jgi:uncharacterized cupin superfamily protein
VKEAELRQTETGLVPEGEGWFVMNLRDASWASIEGVGKWVGFGADDVRQQLGVGVHVLMPGEAPGLYHAESDQEGFLVLAGECILLVEGEERRMQQWDYFHCPPGTAHITVGAGDAPCAIFMLGARTPGKLLDYIPDPVAVKHGVAPKERTGDAREAYADQDWTHTPVKAPWP